MHCISLAILSRLEPVSFPHSWHKLTFLCWGAVKTPINQFWHRSWLVYRALLVIEILGSSHTFSTESFASDVLACCLMPCFLFVLFLCWRAVKTPINQSINHDDNTIPISTAVATCWLVLIGIYGLKRVKSCVVFTLHSVYRRVVIS